MHTKNMICDINEVINYVLEACACLRLPFQNISLIFFNCLFKFICFENHTCNNRNIA